MTRRQRRRSNSAALPIVAAFGLVIAVSLLIVIARWLPLIVGVGVACYLWGRSRRSTSPPGQLATPTAALDQLGRERDQLAETIARLETQLADARASADLAWDAAAERPPAAQQPADSDRRSTLLADARSGARPLIPS